MVRIKQVARKSTGGNGRSAHLEDAIIHESSLQQIQSAVTKHLLNEDLSFLVEHVQNLTLENIADITKIKLSVDVVTPEYAKHEMNGMTKLTQFLMQAWMLKENQYHCIVLVGSKHEGVCDVVKVTIAENIDIPFFYNIAEVQRSYTELGYVFDSMPHVYAKGNAEVLFQMVDCSVNRFFLTHLPANTGKLYLRPNPIACKSTSGKAGSKILDFSFANDGVTNKSCLEQVKSMMIDHLHSEDLSFLIDHVYDLTLEDVVDVTKVDFSSDSKAEHVEHEINGVSKVTQLLIQRWLLKENQNHCIVLVRRKNEGGCDVMKAKLEFPPNPDWDNIVEAQRCHTELGYVFPQMPKAFVPGGWESLCQMMDCACNRKFLIYLPSELHQLYGFMPTDECYNGVYLG